MKVSNPVELIDPPQRRHKEAHWLTPDELVKLLTHPHPPYIEAALLFLVDTGARVGELGNLKLDDLKEMPWGYMAIVTGKTGARMVPLSYETYHSLKQTLPFSYSPYALRRNLSRAFRHAGVRGSSLTLRHTFGTLWEGDELILQHIMGHANLATTKGYRHLRTKLVSAQHRTYSPLNLVLARAREVNMV